jgi:hypothetical protein
MVACPIDYIPKYNVTFKSLMIVKSFVLSQLYGIFLGHAYALYGDKKLLVGPYETMSYCYLGHKEWLVVARMVGGYKNGWWLWSSQEQLNQLEKKPERERALTHATVGWVNTGQGKCTFSMPEIVKICLPRFVFQKLLF